MTFLEIYNETVRDLLVDKVSEQANLQILINPDGGSYVPDLNRYEITVIDGLVLPCVEDFISHLCKRKMYTFPFLYIVNPLSH